MAQSLETLRSGILTSLYGRRAGLDKDETLVGVKDVKKAIQDLTTATTGTAVPAHGVSRQTATGSSQGPTQHLLDAPIPGVSKILALDSSSTGSHQFLTTAAGAAVRNTTAGTTSGVINLLGPASFVELIGVTTALWLVKALSPYGSSAGVNSVSFSTST